MVEADLKDSQNYIHIPPIKPAVTYKKLDMSVYPVHNGKPFHSLFLIAIGFRSANLI